MWLFPTPPILKECSKSFIIVKQSQKEYSYLFVYLFICVCFGAASHSRLRWHTIRLKVGKYVPLHTQSRPKRLHLQQHRYEEPPVSQQCGLYRVSQ
jgi:hypothetical protein